MLVSPQEGKRVSISKQHLGAPILANRCVNKAKSAYDGTRRLLLQVLYLALGCILLASSTFNFARVGPGS